MSFMAQKLLSAKPSMEVLASLPVASRRIRPSLARERSDSALGRARMKRQIGGDDAAYVSRPVRQTSVAKRRRSKIKVDARYFD
jgi:hypothetical protein